MKRVLRRAISREFRQIDDFRSLCQSLKHHGPQYPDKINRIISRMSIKRTQIIGDDLLLKTRSIPNTTGCSVATLIDNVSRNNLYCGHHDDLKSMTINQLQTDHIHFGHKLECKLIAIPSSNRLNADYSLSECIIIEDVNGDTASLYIYNLNLFGSNSSRNLMIGDSISLQQPYWKRMVDGSIALRTDNPLFNIRTEHNFNQNVDSISSLYHHPMTTFVHPDIRMEFINDTKGRGITSKIDIPSNTLILKEPPMSWTVPNRYGRYGDEVMLFAVDMDRDKVYWHSDALHDLRVEMEWITRFGTDYDRYLLSILHHETNESNQKSVGQSIVDLDIFRNRMSSVPVQEIKNFNVNEIASIINCNAFRVCNDDQVMDSKATPSALIVVASLFYHGEGQDCNIKRHFVWTEHDKSCELWTTRDIGKGEELNIDYGYDPIRSHKNW